METAIIAGFLSLLGVLISGAFTHGENDTNVERQKELADYNNQWNSESAKVDRAISAGATPAAAIQSALGSGNTVLPTVSSSQPFSVPNLGDTFASAKLKDSEILTNREQARMFGIQADKLDKYYDAMIDELSSRVTKQNSEAGMFNQQSKYYKEYTSFLKARKPWEIATLAAGLRNTIAQYDNILADTKLKDSESSLNAVKEQTELTQQEVNRSVADYNYSAKLNVDLEGYRLQFENDIRSSGINPNSPMGQNIVRLMVSNPWQARKLLDNMYESANDIDGRLQNLLGKNYKRNLKLGLGMYYGYKAYDTMRDNALNGLNSFTGSIGNLVPFAHPSRTTVSGFR